MTRLRAYAGLARTGARTPWMYRSNMVMSLVFMAVQVVLFTVVWRAIYRGRGIVNGVDSSTAVAYAILALATTAVLNPWRASPLPDRVREGKIIIDLMRPQSLVEQAIAGQVGQAAAFIPTVAVALIAGAAVGGLVAPASAGAAGGFVLSLFLALIVGQLLTFIVSLQAFWTMEIGGPMMIYNLLAALLAGGLVPLWLMPGWLRSTAQWLPFQASTFTPLSIYMGRPPGGVAAALGVQCVWIVVLTLLGAGIWRRAQHRVVVQGG